MKQGDETRMMYGEFSFGWEEFTLASQKEKEKYVWVHLAEGLRSDCLSGYEAALLANGLLDTNYYMPWNIKDHFYIDHQSKHQVPRPHGGNTIMQDYVDLLKQEIINNPHVVICGGNDNSEEDHHLLQYGKSLNVWSALYNSTRFVTDPLGHLTFFGNGNKYRTNNLKTGKDPTHSTVPELVDLKITNACNRGCPWCMEDSTSDGIHADNDTLFRIAYNMGNAGVLEVAIGGGEPTLHPNFSSILRDFNRYGVTPNFSTGSMDWLLDENICTTVKECCGAVAYSTQSIEDALKWIQITDDLDIQTAIHFIVGLDQGDSLTDLLLALMTSWGGLECRVVLLGLKARGRYAGKEASNGDWWKSFTTNDNVMKLLNGWIAIDSVLVPDIKEHLPEVDPKTYEISDGRFSMYWDAVKGEIGPSSHLPNRITATYDALTTGWQQIVEKTLSEELGE
jgi:hypothetical protein